MAMKNLLFVIALFLLAACHNANDAMLMDLGDRNDDFEYIYEIPPTQQPAPPFTNETSGSEEITKKVIKTGEIDFQSEQIEEDYKKIRALLPKYNAYIENENQSKSAQRIQYNLTIRVPSTVYDSLFSSISTLAFRLDNRHSNVEDVTERYYDLKSRIKNKKALEQRYLDLLQKASAMKDILEIEQHLNEVRLEIEQIQGQFNYLSKQVSLSTIDLSFYEILPYVYDSTQRKGFGARIFIAMDNGWQGFLSFLVGLATLWPFVILTFGGIYLFRKVRRKWKKKNV
jgi:hypothetical protein